MQKIIGIRVPQNSNLPERLGILGYTLKMTHGELLERMIFDAEDKLIAAGGQPGIPASAEIRAKFAITETGTEEKSEKPRELLPIEREIEKATAAPSKKPLEIKPK